MGGARSLAEERRALNQLMHASKDEGRLEVKEKKLLKELKTLFVREAGFWHKMSAHERELKRRTVGAKRQLHETQASIVVVRRAIKLMKIKMLKQAMLRREKRYESTMMNEIRVVKLHLER